MLSVRHKQTLGRACSHSLEDSLIKSTRMADAYAPQDAGKASLLAVPAPNPVPSGSEAGGGGLQSALTPARGPPSRDDVSGKWVLQGGAAVGAGQLTRGVTASVPTNPVQVLCGRPRPGLQQGDGGRVLHPVVRGRWGGACARGMRASALASAQPCTHAMHRSVPPAPAPPARRGELCDIVVMGGRGFG